MTDIVRHFFWYTILKFMSEQTIKVEYRTWFNGLPPKRIKLDIGGWAGENTWAVPQPWHCKPYADASTYGFELVYNWETTATVTCDDKGKCTFEGDFSEEKPKYLGKKWEPMACFAPFHFGYVSMIDIKTPPDHNLLIQPHPRVFSCRDGSTPVAVPGMLEMDWWPEIFFMVFKAPLPNCKYVFKKGDPIASCMIVPRNIKYDIQEMSEEENTLRAARQKKLEDNWNRICTRVFYCQDADNFFDNKYKVLSNIAKRDGVEQAGEYMDNPRDIPHYCQNPAVIEHRPEDKQDIKHSPWTEEQLKQFAKEKEQERTKIKAMVQQKEESSEAVVTDENLGEVDELIAKADDFNAMSEDEFNKLITAFKRQKRKNRQDRSQKLKHANIGVPVKPTKPIDKSKIVAINKTDDQWVLGHKIERLKK